MPKETDNLLSRSTGQVPSGTFRVTTYRGSEADILAIRNANRETAQSSAYLDWRYQTPADQEQPEVFWLDGADLACVGMASLIPRTFWFDGKSQVVAVMGDISLATAQRGKGIGRQFLGALTEHCQTMHPGRSCLVIPTEAARRPLDNLGWRTAGKLIQHVLLLDPRDKLNEKMGDDTLSGPLGAVYSSLLKSMLWLRKNRGYSLERTEGFDESFDRFWRDFPKKGFRLADRSLTSLNWRYTAHPNQRFQVSRLIFDSRLVGYIIFEINGRTCSVYDLLARSPKHLAQMLAMFVQQIMEESLASIRITLNDAHPYRRALLWMGFIGRQDHTVFQVHGPCALPESDDLRWMLTQGDKDI